MRGDLQVSTTAGLLNSVKLSPARTSSGYRLVVPLGVTHPSQTLGRSALSAGALVRSQADRSTCPSNSRRWLCARVAAIAPWPMATLIWSRPSTTSPAA